MRFLYVFSLFLLLSACSYSVLDQEFNADYYNNYYKKMLQDKSISKTDVFLINYSVLRQRDYYNYEVEGKTYGEILEQAKGFYTDGLPISTVYEVGAAQPDLSIVTTNKGSGTARPNPKSSQLIKVFLFNATYKNTSAEDIAILNSSFVIKGPFREHITTAGYEINCLIKANDQVEIAFLVDARAITENILHQSNYALDYLDVETILSMLTIEPGGSDVEQNPKFFEQCIRSSARREPFKVLDYAEDMKDEDWIVTNDEGKVIKLQIGNTHLKPDMEEEIRTIELGN